MGLLSWAVIKWANSEYKEYGTMQTLNIDTDNKIINVQILLAGEEQPITIITSYSLDGDNLKLSNISISRTWMSVLVNQFTGGSYTVSLSALPSTLAKLFL